jgi:hypothetical protein
MPTIDQLAPATAASDTDEILASQSGITRKVTRAQIVSGLQPSLSVPSGSLLGRASTGIGAPETLTIGANLSLSAGTLSATTAYVIDALPAGTVPVAGDLVGMGQGGANTAIPYAQFMSGLPVVAGVDGSQLTVTPTGTATSPKLADFIADSLPLAGGTLTGELTLAADPLAPLQAVTKQYADAGAAAAIPKAGGTMTGALTLSANPSSPLQAATKQYVDSQVGTALPLSGGTLSGALTLAADPVLSAQAATKHYVDSQVASSLPIGGGTLAGPLILASDPTVPLQAVTKHYVDNSAASGLPTTGGTLTGPLTLAADPTAALQAATKHYVDTSSASGLPITGGVLSGSLTAPTITTTGNTTVGGTLTSAAFKASQIGSQTTVTPTQINLQRVGSGPDDGALFTSTVTVNHSGGAPLSYSNAVLTTTVNDAVNANGQFVDGTTSDVYAFVSALNVNAVKGANATVTASQHVAIAGTATKSAPSGGYPAGRTGAEVWALWLPLTDATSTSSDVGGPVTGIEMDLSANNLDPVNRRFGYQMVLGDTTATSAGGVPCEWAYGLYYTSAADSYYKFQISAGGNYSVAVLDTRNAFGGKSQIKTALASPGPTIAVDPVLPFTSAGVYGLPVSSSNTAQIKVGSSVYTQVGYTLDGAGKTSGTLTFSTAVTVADGAAGSAVIGASRTIWMGTGQQIAFDYGGAVNLFYDTSIGSMHLSAPLQVDGQLNAAGGISGTSIGMANNILALGNITAGNATSGNAVVLKGAASGGAVSLTAAGKDTNIGVTVTSVGTGVVTLSGSSVAIPNGALTISNGNIFSAGGYTGTNVAVTDYVLAYGTGQFNSMLTANGGLTVANVVNLPKYKVASLPAATEGALVYAQDGRKPGETAGAGTGVLVVGSKTAQWISVTGGAAVAA